MHVSVWQGVVVRGNMHITGVHMNNKTQYKIYHENTTQTRRVEVATVLVSRGV